MALPRIKQILYYLPAVVFLVPLIQYYFPPNKPDLVIIPGDKKLTVNTYTDSLPDGKNSRCSIKTVTNAGISFDFAISKEHLLQGKEPYAGIQIGLTGNTDSCVDVSRYTHLCIDIAARHTSYFSVFLKTYMNGFTVPGNWKTYFFEQSTVQVHEGNEYCIPIKEFSPPNWQPRAHLEAGGNRALFLPNKPDWTKLIGIDIKSGPGTLPDQTDQFVITRIAFIAKPGPLWLIVSLCGFCAYLLTVFIAGLWLGPGLRQVRSRAAGLKMAAWAGNPFLYIIPAAVFLVPLLLYTPDKVIFPGKKKPFVGAYSDSSANGKGSSSRIITVSNSNIVFDYTLSREVFLQGVDPYAAIFISLAENQDSCIDISKYSHMRVSLVTGRGAYCTVLLKTFIRGFTDFGNWKTYHFEQYTTQVRGHEWYDIPLKKFSPPDWLLKANLDAGGPRAMFLPAKPDWTKLFGIDIKSGPEVPDGRPDRISISKIAFISERNPFCTYATLGGLGACLCIGCLAWFFSRQRKPVLIAPLPSPAPDSGVREKPVPTQPVPPYEPKTLLSRFDEECRKIENFIGRNFNDPAMSLDMISRNTLVPSNKISEILRKKHNLSFPEYLNAIRIDQAKKYLAETPDRTIIDIALSVGYGNPNNFDRVFKKLVGVSPKSFREKVRLEKKR